MLVVWQLIKCFHDLLKGHVFLLHHLHKKKKKLISSSFFWFRNMSVSVKNYSEDTVSSTYRFPVIDLCSDDEMPVDVSHAKTMVKVHHVHMHDPPLTKQKNVKKRKFTHPNMPKFEELNGQKINALVQPLFGWTVEENDKGKAKNCAPSVVLIDTSDESSG